MKKEVWCVVIPCSDIERALEIANNLENVYEWNTFIKSIELQETKVLV